MPRAQNLPDLPAWSRVAYNQDMPHFTQIDPEPAMTRSPSTLQTEQVSAGRREPSV